MKGAPHLLLRLGAGLAFLYPPLMALRDPVSWLSYFPSFMRELPIPETLLLQGFGVVEIIIALWILSGRRIFIPSTLATLMFIAIVAFNWNQLDVLFRDLSIAALTAALALDALKRTNSGDSPQHAPSTR